ncbi:MULTISPECIES: hypothetical protein [unclassified Flavobacterium]|uniref:hypothetical protein n=1 Tax=unclassified Flavobacterium TaxID=196869 RepID=UPI00131D6A87|nr:MULTISPECIES: hypothetical protein [unclassified Flavobacterium]
MKETARYLEFIKYFTLKQKSIKTTTKANVEKVEKIKDKYIQLSGNNSFNIESIIIDFGADYSSSLQEKEQHFYFAKNPINNLGNYKIIQDPDGLMKPAIINDYVKDGKSFKRYIFPSNEDNTYSFDYKLFDEWYQTTLVDIDKNYSRPRSLNILVEQSSTGVFDIFLNETFPEWKSRFTTAKDLAISGEFYWFSLYDPRIYEYELSFEDRKSILNYMVYSLYWPIIIEGIDGTNNVDEYELFTSLITIANKADSAKLYNYMFAIGDSSTQKTNLQIYEDKLPSKLYDILLKTLISSFYQTKELSELQNGFRKDLLYPIGFLEKGSWEMGYSTYFDLDEQKEKGAGPFRLGVKYNIEITNNLSIHIKSAVRYRYNYIPYFKRIEYEQCKFIGDGTPILKYDDVIYVSPFLANEEFNGLNIAYGNIMPIPAFALKWLVDQNEDTKNIIDLIERGATLAGVIFPILEIYQAAFLIDIVYESIGLGFTLASNTLGAGLQDQIKKYDESKSTSGNPYRKGQELLSYYYLLSSLYGLHGIKNAISDAAVKDKIKVLFQFETILSAKGVRDDFRSYMSLQHPDDNIDSFNIMSNDIDQIEKEFNKYKYLRNQKSKI